MLVRLPRNQHKDTYKILIESEIPLRFKLNPVKENKYLREYRLRELFPEVDDMFLFLKNHRQLHGFYYDEPDRKYIHVHPDTVVRFFKNRWKRLIREHLKKFPIRS